MRCKCFCDIQSGNSLIADLEGESRNLMIAFIIYSAHSFAQVDRNLRERQTKRGCKILCRTAIFACSGFRPAGGSHTTDMPEIRRGLLSHSP